MFLSATYIMKTERGRKSRWTISQKCEWQVKRFEPAWWMEQELGPGGFGKAGDLTQSTQRKGGGHREKTGEVLRPARGKGAGLRMTREMCIAQTAPPRNTSCSNLFTGAGKKSG